MEEKRRRKGGEEEEKEEEKEEGSNSSRVAEVIIRQQREQTCARPMDFADLHELFLGFNCWPGVLKHGIRFFKMSSVLQGFVNGVCVFAGQVLRGLILKIIPIESLRRTP